MAVGINNALFQTGQNHINRKAKKDKVLQKDNVQTRGSKQVSSKQNYSKSGGVSDDAVSTYADITTKNGIGISVKSDNGIANTYKTKDDGVMLQLSDDSDIEIEDDSVSGDKSSQKTKKEEEYEKFQKQLYATHTPSTISAAATMSCKPSTRNVALPFTTLLTRAITF